MLLKSRLILACAAMLSLSSCGLIGTAIRLAPYALLFAEEEGRSPVDGKTVEMRAREVQNKKGNEILPAEGSIGSRLAFRR